MLICILLAGRFDSSTLGGGAKHIVGRPELNSADSMIPPPTRVGGASGEGALRSARDPDPRRRARILVRAADRVPGDRGHARAPRRTRLAGRTAYDAVDRRTRGGRPRTAALRARRFPFAAPAAYWILAAAISFGDGLLLAFIGSLGLVGLASAFLLGNLRDPLKASVGLIIVVVGIVVWLQHPRPTDSRRLRIHSPPVRGRLGRGLRLA